MFSRGVKLHIRKALDVLGTQESNGRVQQIYVTVTRTAVWPMEMSLVHAILFSGLGEVGTRRVAFLRELDHVEKEQTAALSPCYRLSKKLGKGKRQRVPAEAEGGMVVMMVFRRNPAPRKCPQTGWLSSLLLSAAPGDQRTGHTHCRPPSSAGTGQRAWRHRRCCC